DRQPKSAQLPSDGLVCARSVVGDVGHPGTLGGPGQGVNRAGNSKVPPVYDTVEVAQQQVETLDRSGPQWGGLGPEEPHLAASSSVSTAALSARASLVSVMPASASNSATSSSSDTVAVEASGRSVASVASAVSAASTAGASSAATSSVATASSSTVSSGSC